MGGLAVWHWIVLIAVVMLLFGYRKLPDAARSLGRSMRIFKSEVSGLREDDAARRTSTRPAPPQSPPVIEGEPVVRPATSTAEEPSRARED